MKLADIKQKSDQELGTLLTTQRNELTKAVLESRTKEIKNVKTQAAFKRAIARIMTVMRKRELAGGPTETNQEQAS
jgi:ribosomal protein L29